MQKGKYYFDKLSDKQQIEFKENCKLFEWFMDEQWSGMNEFICSAFIWDRTPQGDNYWSKIAKRI